MEEGLKKTAEERVEREKAEEMNNKGIATRKTKEENKKKKKKRVAAAEDKMRAEKKKKMMTKTELESSWSKDIYTIPSFIMKDYFFKKFYARPCHSLVWCCTNYSLGSYLLYSC